MYPILVKHSYAGKSLEQEAGSLGFLLTDKKGSYFLGNSSSRFRGMHSCIRTADGWDLFKTIDSIDFGRTAKKITNQMVSYDFSYDGAKVSFLLHESCLLMRGNGDVDALITLDMRKIYDFSEWGRTYKPYSKDGCTVFRYEKDDGKGGISYLGFLAFRTSCSIGLVEEWREQKYEEEEKRGSTPSSLWVFDALRLKSQGESRTTVAFSQSEDDAISRAINSFRDMDQIFEAEALGVKMRVKHIPHHGRKEEFAYCCALNSLDRLEQRIGSETGIYAGLPWFFQFWQRDEAISLGAVIKTGHYHLARKIALSRMTNLLEDGRLPNRYPPSSLASADGAPWLFFRVHELMVELDMKNLLKFYLEDEDVRLIRRQLQFSIERLRERYVKEDLIWNGPKETWMDTEYAGDDRDGYRIEMQALWLSMLSFRNYLDAYFGEYDASNWKEEIRTRKKVKEDFFKDRKLWDGKNDPVQRPNVFMAYYLYPELLKHEEWIDAFNASLAALWLEWGGLASIDKRSPLYKADYSGQDNMSYHRGDSWYFLNNMAALCMHRLDRRLYKRYIGRILEASSDDILFGGLAGWHSELSSASSRRSEASLAQAWSSAMFIELIKELGR